MAHSAISMINVNRKTAANLDKLRGLQECDGKNKPDSKSGFMQFLPTQLFSTSAIICTLLFSIASTSVQAGKIYRWTDENGQMHFSENPPRGVETETVKIKSSSGGSATSTATSSSATDKPAQEKQAPEQLTSDYSDEDKAKYCQQSKTLLSQMQGNANRRFQQEDGSYQRLTDEQRADYIAEAKDGIERFCQ